MENKNVGYLVIGISLIFMIVILLFYSTLKGISGGDVTCPINNPCPLYQTLNYQFISFLNF